MRKRSNNGPSEEVKNELLTFLLHTSFKRSFVDRKNTSLQELKGATKNVSK